MKNHEAMPDPVEFADQFKSFFDNGGLFEGSAILRPEVVSYRIEFANEFIYTFFTQLPETRETKEAMASQVSDALFGWTQSKKKALEPPGGFVRKSFLDKKSALQHLNPEFLSRYADSVVASLEARINEVVDEREMLEVIDEHEFWTPVADVLTQAVRFANQDKMSDAQKQLLREYFGSNNA